MEQIENPDNHKRGPKTKIAKVVYFANGVRAMDMRTSGMSWGEIALALGNGISENTALKMARDAREKLEQETAGELRLVHHERYEFMYKSLVPQITKGTARSIEVAAKVLENDAKLMGINADVETQQGNFQPILIQITPHPNDPEAKRLATERKSAKNAIIDSQPKLLPAPDSSV